MDFTHLQIFEQGVKPAAFLTGVGKDCRTENGLTLSDCPVCSSDLQVLPSGFLCSSRNCSFRAGSVLDYAAFLIKDSTFVKAVEELWGAHSEGFEYFSSFRRDEVVPEIARLALYRRKIFEFFLRLHLAPPPVNYQISTGIEWLERRNIHHQSTALSALIVSDKQVRALLNLTSPDNPVSWKPGGHILFPFMGNHHSVSDVLLWPVKGKNIINLPVMPFLFSFSGLMEASPGDQLTICSDPIASSALNTIYRRETAGLTALSIHYNRSGYMSPLSLDRPCFLYEPGTPVGAVAAYSKITPSLRVRVSDLVAHKDSATSPWSSFILAEIVTLLKSEGLTDRARLLMDSAQLSVSETSRLVSLLRQSEEYKLLDTVEGHLQQAPVFQQDAWSLFVSPSGYTASRKDDLRRKVTNFIIDLKTNLVFADSEDLFHRGEVVFQGQRFPVLLDHRHLDNPRDLETVVRAAESRSPRSGEVSIPSVLDTKLLRLLVAFLRTVVADLPRSRGLSYLGWNRAYTRFCAPTWQADCDSLHEVKFVFHPDCEALRFYSSTPPDDDALHGQLSTGICEMISQLIAMTARSYLDLPIKPIVFKDTTTARNVLQGLFQGIGQSEIYRLSFNIRYAEEIRSLHGYPILATGYSPGQIEKSKLPAFFLAEQGIDLGEESNSEEIPLAAGVFRRALQSVVSWLLRTEGRDFVREHSISNDLELVREGQFLLKSVCGFAHWPESPPQYQMVEKLLHMIPADRVPAYFQHDLAKQKVHLLLKLVPKDIDLSTLELELRERCESFTRKPDRFTLDALTATQILNNFYQGKAYPSPIVEEVQLQPDSGKAEENTA